MRLIDADSLRERLKKTPWYKEDQLILDFVNEEPTVSVTPHGAWIERNDDSGMPIIECSKCGKIAFKAEIKHACFDSIPKRCPYCGAELEVLK